MGEPEVVLLSAHSRAFSSCPHFALLSRRACLRGRTSHANGRTGAVCQCRNRPLHERSSPPTIVGPASSRDGRQPQMIHVAARAAFFLKSLWTMVRKECQLEGADDYMASSACLSG